MCNACNDHRQYDGKEQHGEHSEVVQRGKLSASARQLAQMPGYESGIDADKICQEHAGASDNIRHKGSAGSSECIAERGER